MPRFTVPTEQQKEIMRRNGIDVDSVSMVVKYADKDTLHLCHHDTRDEIRIHDNKGEITIHRGDKQW